MSAIDPKILNKIKKCLALSQSPNPHEAAAAMRQANNLMRMHGVEAHHVARAEIGEACTEILTMARDKPARWEGALASLVGKAFGCKMIMSRSVYKQGRGHLNEGQFIFIGQRAQAEIAAYTASVLTRKCKSARSRWITEHLKGRLAGPGSRAKITALGDTFADGWVYSISKLVTHFANPPDLDRAIDERIKSMEVGGDAPSRTAKTDGMSSAAGLAARMGAQAAAGESLYRPMGTEAPALAIGMSEPDASEGSGAEVSSPSFS